MPVKVTPFDAADYLDTQEAQAAFLADAIEEGDAPYVAHALAIVARARRRGDDGGEQAVATVRADDPPLSALFDMLRSLGVRLTVSA